MNTLQDLSTGKLHPTKKGIILSLKDWQCNEEGDVNSESTTSAVVKTMTRTVY